MPTGYTCKLYDGEQTFQEFAMRCARAFGATISMRDISLDTVPTPEAIARASSGSYNAIALEKAQTQLDEEIPLEEAEKRVEAEYEKVLEQWKISNAERKARIQRYDVMEAQVKAWKPPTEDHAGMRTFMLEQLATCIFFDRSYDPAPPERESAATWRANYYRRAEDAVIYHTSEVEKEGVCNEGRIQWVQDLITSLK